MIGSFRDMFKIPELRSRIGFTVALLIVYRVGGHVLLPGVNQSVIQQFFDQQAGNMFKMYDMFAGGNLSRASIFALGIMPYISASIIMQIATAVVPYFEKLQKEGDHGRKRIDQLTRYGTVLLGLVQSAGISRSLPAMLGQDAITMNPNAFMLLSMLTLTSGTIFVMWLGEQITERGIGNGISLIIMASIITGVPTYVFNYFAQNQGDIRPLTSASVVAVLVLCVATVAFFENGRRLIPIVYSRRQVGRRVYGGQTAHLPLKVNTAGVIPPIFASSLLMFPATLASMNVPGMDWLQQTINAGDWLFNTGFGLLIIFFCFFYTNVVFQPVDVAENLKKQQANIPGIRPGKQTAEFIDHVMQRITFAGAMYVATICVLPSIFGSAIGVPITFGGTSVMIVVGVALDTMNQIESHLLKRSYEGLTGPGTGRIRGRRLPQTT